MNKTRPLAGIQVYQSTVAELALLGASGKAQGMIHVTLRVHPGARVNRVSALADGTLDVHVRAVASEGRANAAVVTAIAAAARLRPRQVQIVRGERSRQKVVAIDGLSQDELRRRLGATTEREG
jgi:uncharacterized protein (TIGR00251 family)